MKHGVITEEERSTLTVWGEHMTAQMRYESDGTKLVFFLSDDAPRSSEEGNPAVLSQDDAAKLHALLDENHRREEARILSRQPK